MRFIAGDILEPVAAGPFDAIVSRLVLMYVSNAASVLRTQSHQLRPGGIVVPIEFDLPSARSLPPTPLVAQALSWLNETFTEPVLRRRSVRGCGRWLPMPAYDLLE